MTNTQAKVEPRSARGSEKTSRLRLGFGQGESLCHHFGPTARGKWVDLRGNVPGASILHIECILHIAY